MKTPTKQQIKVARRRMKKANALRREAWKVLRQIRRRRSRVHVVRNPEERAYRVWEHDFHVLLPAVVRSAGHDMAPESIVLRAAAAADRMASEVQARRPSEDTSLFIRRRGRGAAAKWWQWQEAFDGFVHDLSSNTMLGAEAVIDRAIALTDLKTKVIEERKSKWKRGRSL